MGLQSGDIITKINNKNISDLKDFYELLAKESEKKASFHRQSKWANNRDPCLCKEVSIYSFSRESHSISEASLWRLHLFSRRGFTCFSRRDSMHKEFVTCDTVRNNAIKLAYKIYRDGFIPDIIYVSLRGGAYMGNVISEYFKFVKDDGRPVLCCSCSKVIYWF